MSTCLCPSTAFQSRLRYQEAVEELNRVKEEWGPALGLEISVGTSPRTVTSSHTSLTDATVEDASEAAGSTSVNGKRNRDEVNMLGTFY